MIEKRKAAGLAAKIVERLKITPVIEKGTPGQLDVFVGDTLVASHGGLMKSLFGPNKDTLVDEIAKHLKPAT
jgi:hypothetical protein